MMARLNTRTASRRRKKTNIPSLLKGGRTSRGGNGLLLSLWYPLTIEAQQKNSASPAAKVQPEKGRNYCGLHFDINQCGKADCQEENRKPPLNTVKYNRLMNFFFEARDWDRTSVFPGSLLAILRGRTQENQIKEPEHQGLDGVCYIR